MEKSKKLAEAYGRFIVPSMDALAVHAEQEVLRFLMDRSLRFGWHAVDIWPSEFFQSRPNACLMPLQMSVTTMRRKRSRLLKHKYVFYRFRPNSSTSKVNYTINVYGICRLLANLWAGSKASPVFMELSQESAGYLVTNGWDAVDIIPLLGRSRLADLKKSLKWRPETPFKADTGKALTSSDLQAFLFEICREHGVVYYEDTWTDRTMRNVRYFIKRECEEKEWDPRERLTLVISKWHEIRGNIMNDRGMKVPLPPTFSFKDFFAWRNELIQQALAVEESDDRLERLTKGLYDNNET